MKWGGEGGGTPARAMTNNGDCNFVIYTRKKIVNIVEKLIAYSIARHATIFKFFHS